MIDRRSSQLQPPPSCTRSRLSRSPMPSSAVGRRNIDRWSCAAEVHAARLRHDIHDGHPTPHSRISVGALGAISCRVQVLTAFLGDTISFADSTQVDIGQPPRTFANFSAALEDVAVSRIYAGVHYVPAVVDGVTQGRCVGERVLQRLKTR